VAAAMETSLLAGSKASGGIQAQSTAVVGRALVWSDVGFSVGDKQILQSCTGQCRPGTLTAIVGPSGAGKTTLLNVLAGRLPATHGGVTLGSTDISRSDCAREIAYVTQEDSLFAHTTPREAMAFSARLRLPRHMADAEKLLRAEKMVELLGLQSCADTYVGSEMHRGISGGEKKRTSIGVELVTNPMLLLLDEPTSGLDSFAAVTVVRSLKALAQSGCGVLCTIHQPSSEVFALFDHVLLMGAGTQMYNGPHVSARSVHQRSKQTFGGAGRGRAGVNRRRKADA
jgi:ABC-type multidrug transport system ATPase subunit